MSKLYFYYSAMNAGKSTILLQSSYNYQERGMRTLLFMPLVDTRAGVGRIQSRIGLSADAIALEEDVDLLERVRAAHAEQPVACVLIDEAQFLTRPRCARPRTSRTSCTSRSSATGCARISRAALFPGSAELLALADKLIEIKTICHCGCKATMNLRINADGRAVKVGAQVEIGGNDRYIAVCRRHFKEALASA